MKKIFYMGLLLVMAMACLASCSLLPSNEQHVQESEIPGIESISDRLVYITDIYYYDKHTKNIFLWNGAAYTNNATVPVPYPKEDGTIYKWNELEKRME